MEGMTEKVGTLIDSDEGPALVFMDYKNMNERELRQAFLLGDIRAIEETMRRKGDTNSLIAACYSAACRPPTSGGTGGSLPRGAVSAPVNGKIVVGRNGKKINVHPDVADIAAPQFRETEFTRTFRAAVDAEPALRNRMTMSEWRDKVTNLTNHAKQVVVDSARENFRRGDVDLPHSIYTNEHPDVMVHRRELRDALNAGEHHKYLDDPKLKPKGAEGTLDFALWKITQDFRQRVESTEDQFELFNRYGVGGAVDIGGKMIPFSIPRPMIRYRPPSRQVIMSNPVQGPESEAAATRVGKVIMDEMNRRLERATLNYGEQHERGMAALRELVQADEGTAMRFSDGKLYSYVKDGVTHFTYSDPSDQLASADIIKKFELHSPDPTLSATYASNLAKRQVYLSVMQEVRPMGGVMHGTPQYRAPQPGKGRSAHELAIEGSLRFPTAWIEASNFRGEVTFRKSDARAHYDDGQSTISLDKSIGTAVHEIAHRMEFTVPGFAELEATFYARRTAGSDLERLRDITPGGGYAASEMTRRDKFFHPYAGKDYGGRAYEVSSMGIEQLATSKYANPLDDDHVAFVLGALATLLPEG